MAISSLPPVSVGAKFGRWTVLSASEPRIYFDKTKKHPSVHRMWVCVCDCGESRRVTETSLKNGGSTSCGCYQREIARTVNCTHREAINGQQTPEYHAWQTMRARCLNPKNKRYAQYGGRGITICNSWLDGFPAFLGDMGRRPSPRHSLDRKDNNKGYSKDNCKWSTPHEQMTNRTVTRYVETSEGRIPLATLAKKHGIPANTLRFRILKGWSLEDALNAPVRDKNPNGAGRKNTYIPAVWPSSRETELLGGM
jgi:hypothetical protein